MGAWSLALSYMGLLYWLSSKTWGGEPLPVSDKLVHAVAYFGLCVVMRLAVGSVIPGAAATVIAVGVTLLYGATDEWHQSFTPGRHPDVLDWVADAVGACVAAGCWILVGRIMRGSSNATSH